VRSYDYWTTVYESGVIAQHISSIVIFIAVFINLEQQKLATNSLIIAGTLLTSLGYIFWDYSVVQTVPSYASKSKYLPLLILNIFESYTYFCAQGRRRPKEHCSFLQLC
jgi:hypothetical protein